MSKNHPITRRTALTLLGGLPLAAGARAQTGAWPAGPIRLIVPFPPAGTTDLLARIIADPLSRALGKTVVVENRAGAGGCIGTEVVAKGPADGYTLLMTTIGTGAINYAIYSNLSWKPADLTGVSLVTKVPNVIMVPGNSPISTLPELVARAKRQPGALNFGSSGNGSSTHVVGELLKLAAGIDMQHIPFRGSGPMLIDLLGGRLDVGIDNLPSSLAHIREGKVKALAITGAERSASLPGVPTTAEAGLPQVEATAWFGLQAPAGVPVDILNKISEECDKVVHQPAVAAQIREQGGDPVGGTAASFEAFIQSEVAKWADVVTRAHIRIE